MPPKGKNRKNPSDQDGGEAIDGLATHASTKLASHAGSDHTGDVSADDQAPPGASGGTSGPLRLEDIMQRLETGFAKTHADSAEIHSRLDGLDSRLEAVAGRVGSVEEKLAQTDTVAIAQGVRLGEAEQRISQLEDSLAAAELAIRKADKTNTALAKTIETLLAKTDDLEDRGRKNNAILRNLPENVGAGQPLFDFVQQRLPIWLNLPPGKPLELECVHRSGGETPEAGKSPRPIYIRFLRYTDRERVLQAAKAATTTIQEGSASLFFHRDLAAGIRRQRSGFNAAIKVLIGKGMFRGFAYPSKLRALHNNSIQLFDTPQEAEKFIEDRGWVMPENSD